MKISELRANQGNVEVKGKITEKGSERAFEKFGKKGRVCSFSVEDDSGSINLSLFNDDIDKANVGDTIEIKNGYVGEWRGELQLSLGRSGTLSVAARQSSLTEDSKESLAPEVKYKVEEDFDAIDVEEENVIDYTEKEKDEEY